MIEVQSYRSYADKDRFEVYCSMCNRTFAVLIVPKGGVFRYEWRMPQVPCHANAIVAQTPPEDPFERVRRLLDGEPEKESNFTSVFHIIDGMLASVEVVRDL